MAKHEDLTRKTFGRLTVLKEVSHPKPGIYIWECECGCENHTHINVNGKNLKNGTTKSCGCIKKELLIKRNRQGRKYDKEHSRLVRIWGAMKARCYNPNTYGYKWYGSKDIKVCDEWHNFDSFKDWAITNGYTDELTIDRIDNNKNYCPENCRWVTWEEQANNASFNKMITYNGKTQSLSMWAKELNLDYNRTKARINSCNWSIEEAFNEPKYSQVNNKKKIEN